VECVGARDNYQQYVPQFTSILKSFQLSDFVVQQYIDFPLPTEAMQQLALSNPTELANQVAQHIQTGKILFDGSEVSPENLYKSVQEYKSAAQLCLAPPQRLSAYDSAAEGLAEATRKFNHNIDEQRFQITSALKDGDMNRAYWAANKMMQMIPDKTDPNYQEAYNIIQSLPPPKE